MSRYQQNISDIIARNTPHLKFSRPIPIVVILLLLFSRLQEMRYLISFATTDGLITVSLVAAQYSLYERDADLGIWHP